MNTKISYRYTQILFSGILLFFFWGCERTVDNLEEPGFSQNPEVFIDGFSGGLNYAAFAGSVPAAFQVDTDITFNGSAASMRYEIPDVGDPRGAYAGGTYFTSSPRDLSEYDALTFWAKSSEAGVLDIVGFGIDLAENKYTASVTGFRVNSNWKKYIIPIPDPTRLVAEQGMFFYSTGPIDGRGYTIWVDEVKFEKLGTVAHPQPTIFNGEDITSTSFTGVTSSVSGLGTVFNLADGTNQVVGTSPAYFEFTSTNEATASVDDLGNITVGEAGTAEITATLSGVLAEGSLTIESQGIFNAAPVPTEAPEDVISIFSDAYDNVPVDFYNGFYAPFQTTTSNDFIVNGNRVLNYENFNFVGIEFNQNVPTINGSSMTHLRMDIFIPNQFGANPALRVTLRDFGADGSFGGNDDTTVSLNLTTNSNPALVVGQWIRVDLNITGMANRANLGQIVLDTDLGPGLRGQNIYVDNIYLRR